MTLCNERLAQIRRNAQSSPFIGSTFRSAIRTVDLNNNGYVIMGGTSMATAYASGVGAMVMWKKGFTNVQARNQINATVDDLGPAGRDDCFGFGRLNLANALG